MKFEYNSKPDYRLLFSALSALFKEVTMGAGAIA